MGASMNDTAQTLADQVLLTVDYGLNFKAMIAAGRFDWTTPDITAKRFPITGTDIMQAEAKLFHFDRYLSSEDAVAAIKAEDPENPWEPAKIEYLLSFGTSNPDEQRRYPIVALGSVARVRGVPCLRGGGGERSLRLYWWDVGYRFLAVRNRSSGS
jgi:hypothetical protein